MRLSGAKELWGSKNTNEMFPKGANKYKSKINFLIYIFLMRQIDVVRACDDKAMHNINFLIFINYEKVYTFGSRFGY